MGNKRIGIYKKRSNKHLILNLRGRKAVRVEAAPTEIEAAPTEIEAAHTEIEATREIEIEAAPEIEIEQGWLVQQ